MCIHMKRIMVNGVTVDVLKGNAKFLSTSAILYHQMSNLEQNRVTFIILIGFFFPHQKSV